MFSLFFFVSFTNGLVTDKRHRVLDPYLPVFETAKEDEEPDVPAHRYLFRCFLYQYHLIQFAWVIIELVSGSCILVSTCNTNVYVLNVAR